ncbi:MAG: hypothetical protein LAT68_03980 [Cyclobacteriaceae bacterium]|nr:hypothetical protein [Cyclobacteriaceae bacterium]MCH8515467.1 hypothetical protein [Cyclobacteriaceae bacterium]
MKSFSTAEMKKIMFLGVLLFMSVFQLLAQQCVEEQLLRVQFIYENKDVSIAKWLTNDQMRKGAAEKGMRFNPMQQKMNFLKPDQLPAGLHEVKDIDLFTLHELNDAADILYGSPLKTKGGGKQESIHQPDTPFLLVVHCDQLSQIEMLLGLLQYADLKQRIHDGKLYISILPD